MTQGEGWSVGPGAAITVIYVDGAFDMVIPPRPGHRRPWDTGGCITLRIVLCFLNGTTRRARLVMTGLELHAHTIAHAWYR